MHYLLLFRMLPLGEFPPDVNWQNLFPAYFLPSLRLVHFNAFLKIYLLALKISPKVIYLTYCEMFCILHHPFFPLCVPRVAVNIGISVES